MAADINMTSDEKKKSSKKGLRRDLHHIIFLLYLYFLQGIPLGMVVSTSTLLASAKTSFSDQGTFSFAFYPFSLKLLWAPVVDSLFVPKIGRRKTWLFLVQALMCIFMLSTAEYVQNLVDNNHKSSGKLVTKKSLKTKIRYQILS